MGCPHSIIVGVVHNEVTITLQIQLLWLTITRELLGPQIEDLASFMLLDDQLSVAAEVQLISLRFTSKWRGVVI